MKLAALLFDLGDTIMDEATEDKDAEGTTERADLIPGMAEVLRAFKAAGHRLALVADSRPRTPENVLRQHGLYDLFEALAVSEIVGFSKPDPRIFRAALDALAIPEADYGRVVMVGNNLERDIAGANRLGLISVFAHLNDRRRAHALTTDEVPRYTVTSAAQLRDLIARLEEKASMTDSILHEDIFPIVGWAGPSDAMIRNDVMRGMAEAGFTVSHSQVNGDLNAVLRALDVAADSGVRLLLVHQAWHVGDDYILDGPRKVLVAELVDGVKKHPGLYGYHLRDEPRFPLLPLLAEVHAFIRAHDPHHLCYINHFPPIEGWGAPTAEAFWRCYIELVQPQMLSYDHYPITVGSADEIRAAGDAPNVIPDEKLIIKPDYFSCLELLRTLSNATRLPFWAFTCSVRHGPYPTPTEGHIRFQLMNDLAYGAKGLQYFTYAHDGAMVRADGSTTGTWDIARRVNADLNKLGPVLRTLHNIGAFRTGPLWSGTQHLHRSHLPPLVACEGDPVTLGFFQDDAERLHLMVVNGSPCAWARIVLKVDVQDGEKLLVYDLDGVQFRELWPADPHHQLVVLAPGEGRLFKVDRAGLGVNF